MSTGNHDYDSLSNMLKAASHISIQEKVKTFFDVAGFPHYENLISNILAFFFDANEEHQLKDLWIKSLFECYNKTAKTNLEPGKFENIEREHATEENKRLDLIISSSTAIIAIENKIYANANNPFDAYHKEILDYKNEIQNKDDIEIVEILLSLKNMGHHTTKNGANFYNITYKTLISRVKENLGNYILSANEKWLIFMKELLNNLENLGETNIMDIQWQKFLKENEDAIKLFFENYRKDIDIKMAYLNSLFDILNEKIEVDKTLGAAISKKGVYGTKQAKKMNGGYFSLYIDIRKKNETIVLEPYVSREKPSHLVIELWNRETKKTDWSKELNTFKEVFPDAKQVDDGTWKKCLRLECMDFEKNFALEETANKLLNIVKVMIGI